MNFLVHGLNFSLVTISMVPICTSVYLETGALPMFYNRITSTGLPDIGAPICQLPRPFGTGPPYTGVPSSSFSPAFSPETPGIKRLWGIECSPSG